MIFIVFYLHIVLRTDIWWTCPPSATRCLVSNSNMEYGVFGQVWLATAGQTEIVFIHVSARVGENWLNLVNDQV